MREGWEHLPPARGYYLLFIPIKEEKQIRVGSLGSQVISPGMYVYAGSALGSGGLRGRLRRHLERTADKKRFWHIDYLLDIARVQAIAFLCAPLDAPDFRGKPLLSIECLFIRTLLTLPLVRVPIPGFGASDCRHDCPAHLIYVPHGGGAGFAEELLSQITTTFKALIGGMLQVIQLTP